MPSSFFMLKGCYEFHNNPLTFTGIADLQLFTFLYLVINYLLL